MSLFGTGRREGVFAVLVLLALCVAVHAPGMFFGQHRSGVDVEALENPAAMQLQRSATALAQSDREAAYNHTLLLPAMAAVGRTARNEGLPLWNAAARFGEPFWVTNRSIFYPAFWPLAMEGGDRTLDWILCLHAFLACMGMYRFLRARGVTRYGAFLGGASYGLGWFLTVNLDRIPEAAAAALLPFALEMTWRMITVRARDAYGGLLAIVLTFMFLTGGTTTAWMGASLCAALFITSISALERSERGHTFRTVGIAIGLTVLGTAPLWLTSSNLAEHVLALEAPTRHLQLGALVGALSPTAATAGLGLDSITGAAALSTLSPEADAMELALYPGALLMVLLCIGLVRPKHSYGSLFWVITGATGILIGLDSPVMDFITSKTGWAIGLPGAGLVLAHVAAVVLGITALDNFLNAPMRRHWSLRSCAITFSVLTAAMVLCAFVWPGVGSRMLGQLLPGEGKLAVIGALHAIRTPLLIHLGMANALAIAFCWWKPLGILRFKKLLAFAAIASLLVTSYMHTARRTYSPLGSANTSSVASIRTVRANRTMQAPGTWHMAQGMPTVGTRGDDLLSRTGDYLALIDPTMVRSGYRPRVLPLYGPTLARHPLLARAAIRVQGRSDALPDLSSLTPPTPLVETTPTVRRSRPERARLAFRAHRAKDKTSALAALANYAASDVPIVENLPTSFSPRAPHEDVSSVQITHDTATRVDIDIETAGGRGILVLADAWAPGWIASVDGKPTPVLKADVAFRAVAVPAGARHVRFEYRPAVARYGLPMAAFGLFLAIAWMLLGFAGIARPPAYR